MSRIVLIISVVVFLFSFPLIGCRSNQTDSKVEETISELAQKEEELKSIGVPSFITQEQAKMEKEETNAPIPELQLTREMLAKETKPQEVKPQEALPRESLPQEALPREVIPREFKTQEVIPQEVKPQEFKTREVKPQAEQLIRPEVKPLSESMPELVKPQVVEKKNVREVKKVSNYPTKSYTKVYFSYRNGYNYVSKDKPCKITTVLFASKDVWYADYNVYAVPLGKAKVYKKYLIKKYLVGIGRNISIVEGRSQLTVYWTGINITKKPLPKGNYIIVSSVHLKNSKKQVIGKVIKVLGTEKPLVVVLK
jgi:hypothetical protein